MTDCKWKCIQLTQKDPYNDFFYGNLQLRMIQNSSSTLTLKAQQNGVAKLRKETIGRSLVYHLSATAFQ